MEKSPAKLHRRLLFAQTILLLGIYPKDILGEIEVVGPCTKELDRILQRVRTVLH